MKLLILGLLALVMLAAGSSFTHLRDSDGYWCWRQEARARSREFREELRAQRRAAREERHRMREEIRQEMRDFRRDWRDTY
jgi:hypothetical protein